MFENALVCGRMFFFPPVFVQNYLALIVEVSGAKKQNMFDEMRAFNTLEDVE